MSKGGHDATSDFARAAREFCAWAEAAPADVSVEVDRARGALAELYRSALSLPREYPDGDDPDDVDIAQDDWQRVYERFGALPLGYYSVCLDPHEVPTEAIGVADLADDLADIWRDLKEGLCYFDAGQQSYAAWHWRWHFDSHWGKHAASALFALHTWSEDPREGPGALELST